MNRTAAIDTSYRDLSQEPLMGLSALLTAAHLGTDLAPIGARLLERAAANPNDANALLDLSILLHVRGDRGTALAMQSVALNVQRRYRLAPRDRKTEIRLLAIMTPGDLGSNTPLEFIVENSDIQLDMLYIGERPPRAETLPEHDVAFIAIAEADRTRSLLAALEDAVDTWAKPVLNRPGRIRRMSREGTSGLLRSAPGVLMPTTVRADRNRLQCIADGKAPLAAIIPNNDFPLIVRPVGSHAGERLAKCDDPAAVAEYLRAASESEFCVAPFVDYRSLDGLFRKYRVALIQGRPYASHMAISENWMIHYLNAGMTESPAKRREEAWWMATFEQDFAVRHARALRAISERIGLDYFCIDCAETRDGRLLVFEADSSAVVHAMDPIDVFPYKRLHMQRLFAGFRDTLARVAHERFRDAEALSAL